MSTFNILNTFNVIYQKNIWGSSESKSGPGSEHSYTENMRNKLIAFIKENNIQNILDTSCGDWNWMKLIQPDLCTYTGIDVVKDIVDNHNTTYANEKTQFINTDFLSFIKNSPSNKYDLILCRHTLEHLPTEYNLEFINECKRVCKYLFLTGYNNPNRTNTDTFPDIRYPYRPINLALTPYSNVLDPFFIEEFYDGPSNRYVSEACMRIYKFTSIQ
jgi:2-polyprenyl-3-methyl-5-hydroxy-6-metoxy-1,4-benzoquinol methylase